MSQVDAQVRCTNTQNSQVRIANTQVVQRISYIGDNNSQGGSLLETEYTSKWNKKQK